MTLPGHHDGMEIVRINTGDISSHSEQAAFAPGGTVDVSDRSGAVRHTAKIVARGDDWIEIAVHKLPYGIRTGRKPKDSP